VNAQAIEQDLEDIKETQRARADLLLTALGCLDRLDAHLARANAHLEQAQKATDLYQAKYGK
jgi:hypothetical protein